MPGRRTDAPSAKKVAAAVAVPACLVALAGTIAFAGPAVAAGGKAASATPTLPFPTSVCGTDSPSASSSPSASPSTSASPSPSASKSPSPSASPSPSSPSTKANAPAGGGGSTASPSASPSASSSSSSSGGFWGWLNGIWTWITGAAQPVPPTTAAPVLAAGDSGSTAKDGAAKNAAGTAQTTAKQAAGAQEVSKLLGAASRKSASGKSGSGKPASVKQAADASADPSPTCIPPSDIDTSSPKPAGNTAAIIPWHLSTPSMTMYGLTYHGLTTIQTVDGPETVMNFTASKVTLLSMVTFSHQGGDKLQFVDGGQNQTVTLTNVQLWSTKLSAKLYGLIPLTFTKDSLPTVVLGIAQGFTIPVPVVFTDVEADNAFLSTNLIDIPGFNGHGN